MWQRWLAVVMVGAAVFCADAQTWYRGNLHAHSMWSDGNVFPEDAIAWYRDNGYQFLCLSDHQILQIDTNAWLEIGSKKLSRAQADHYLSGHPASTEIRRDGFRDVCARRGGGSHMGRGAEYSDALHAQPPDVALLRHFARGADRPAASPFL